MSNLERRLITRGTNDKNAKLGEKGSESGHVTYFRNFGTPSISRERLELETPNFACRFITRGTNDRNANLGTPSISLERLEVEMSNLERSTRGTNGNMQN